MHCTGDGIIIYIFTQLFASDVRKRVLVSKIPAVAAGCQRCGLIRRNKVQRCIFGICAHVT